jgi:hypothetical protein
LSGGATAPAAAPKKKRKKKKAPESATAPVTTAGFAPAEGETINSARYYKARQQSKNY